MTKKQNCKMGDNLKCPNKKGKSLWKIGFDIKSLMK